MSGDFKVTLRQNSHVIFILQDKAEGCSIRNLIHGQDTEWSIQKPCFPEMLILDPIFIKPN